MNDSGKRPKWYPSNRQMAFDWWLRRLTQITGLGMIVWELLADHAHNLAVVLVGAMLGSTTNAIDLVKGLIAQAKNERATLSDLVEQELRREREENERDRGERP